MDVVASFPEKRAIFFCIFVIAMVLFLVGLGLGNPKDITIKGLEVCKTADLVFLEEYTSVLLDDGDKESLSTNLGCSMIKSAFRDTLEDKPEEDLLTPAATKNVVLLIAGDPLSATTHTDLVIRAKKLNVPIEVIHNASIITVAASSGLQPYLFGRTVSIPRWTRFCSATSFMDHISQNMSINLHSLCLLDIKIRELDEDALAQGKMVYLPKSFMTCVEAAKQILEATARVNTPVNASSLVVCLCRMGAHDQIMSTYTLGELADLSDDHLPPPLHSLIIPACPLDVVEAETLSNLTNCSASALKVLHSK